MPRRIFTAHAKKPGTRLTTDETPDKIQATDHLQVDYNGPLIAQTE